jgi:hypothetical protein
MNSFDIIKGMFSSKFDSSEELVPKQLNISHLTDQEEKQNFNENDKDNKEEIEINGEYFVLMIYIDSSQSCDSSSTIVKKYPWLSLRSKYCNSHPLGKYTNSQEALKQLKILTNLTELPTGVKFSIKKLTDHEIIKFIKLTYDSSTSKNIPIENDNQLEQKAVQIYSNVKDNTFYNHGMVKSHKIILLDNYKHFIINID